MYGYSVCLITLIVALFSAQSTLEAALDLSGQTGQFGNRVSGSFEAYLADHPSTIVPRTGEATQDTASLETLRGRWEALRKDQRESASAQASRSLAASGLLLLLALGAFGFHWRWLRRVDSVSARET